MITKTYFMKQFIEPLERKIGSPLSGHELDRIFYIRQYYALLKHHPNASNIISDILASDVLITYNDIVQIINEEGK